MHGVDLLILLGVLVAAAGMLVLAGRLSLPYPILLVVGGALIGVVPGIPSVSVNPDVVLLVALPPLLYQAAFFRSLRELADNARPILSLSIGLVIATTAGVAGVAHAVAGMPWGTAFILGAVLSPTDPVAATAIASRVGAPRRYVTLVEGESLVNDGTGLTLYKLAVTAAVAGGVTVVDGSVSFFVNATGGIAIGVAAGLVSTYVRTRIRDAPTEIVISLLSPYLAYLPAQAAGVSAVLAAVACGVVVGWNTADRVAPATRLAAFATWEVLVFALNTFVFVLIGLSLSSVVHGIEHASLANLARDTGAVVLTVIAVRFAWTYLVGALPRLVRARASGHGDGPPGREIFLVAFTGMRGAVSVAAALAVPVTTDTGAPLQGRALLIFMTYAVVFVTVVGQGLALPPLIRLLYPHGAGDETDREEATARAAVARAALERLDKLGPDSGVPERTLRRMRELYEFRRARFDARAAGAGREELEQDTIAYQRLRQDVLRAERDVLVRLRRQGRIGNDALHRVEHDLDLDEARLEVSEGIGPHAASPLSLADDERD
jgi:CPA1 family monovalent cation:H+ antiporter